MAAATANSARPGDKPVFAITGGGVSFLFHAAEIKPRNAMAGEKISPGMCKRN
jgi:hypothetical protein